MSLRLLLIADRPEYRLLVRKHLEIEWPDAAVAEHRLGEDGALEDKFTAAGREIRQKQQNQEMDRQAATEANATTTYWSALDA